MGHPAKYTYFVSIFSPHQSGEYLFGIGGIQIDECWRTPAASRCALVGNNPANSAVFPNVGLGLSGAVSV